MKELLEEEEKAATAIAAVSKKKSKKKKAGRQGAIGCKTVPPVRGGMQILVKTPTDKTVTLEVVLQPHC
jgi:hypothetical protein